VTRPGGDGLGARLAPQPPAAAREIFGDRLGVVQRYAALLAGPGTDRGLIGPREIDRIWERHILNCAVVTELVPDSARLVDIGSGAGLPGIVLAILRPDLSVILVDSTLKRSVFLGECVAELGLPNAEVRRARAEDLAGPPPRGAKGRHTPGAHIAADVVIARAVAPLRQLAEWAEPLVRPGGTLLAIKGERAREELAEAQGVLRALRVARAEILTVGQDKVGDGTVVVRIVTGDGTGGRSRRERGGRQDLA
jgi:16S rRNA (guanine527-N7)-methyltransferase